MRNKGSYYLPKLKKKKKRVDLIYSHGYAGPESIQAGHASLARLNGSL